MNGSGESRKRVFLPPPGDRYRLIGVLALAAFLRFFRIGQQSYWADEIYCVWQLNGYEGSPFENIVHNFHGPLHFALLWGWGKLGGWGEVWARSLSVIAALVTVWLVYVLARLIAGRRAALWAALLMAISPFHIWYSQEVRNYAMLHLFTVLSMIFFVRIVSRGRGRLDVWAGFVLSSAAALLCNLGAVFLLAFQGIYLLFVRPRLFGKLVAVTAIVFVLLLPWIRNIELGWSLELLREGTPLRRVNFHPLAIPYTFMVYSVGDTVGPSRDEMNRALSFSLFKPFILYFVIAGATFAMLFFRGLKARVREREGLMFFLIWILLPVVFVGALAVLHLKLYNVRYVSVGFPAYLILLAVGIKSCGKRLRVALVVLVLLATFVSLRNLYANPRYWKPDARTAAEEIARDARSDDAIVVYAIEEPFKFYYDGDGEIVSLEWHTPGHWHFEQTIDDLETRFGRVWLVDYRGWYMDPLGRIPEVIGDRWRPAGERRFAGIDVRLYEKRKGTR